MISRGKVELLSRGIVDELSCILARIVHVDEHDTAVHAPGHEDLRAGPEDVWPVWVVMFLSMILACALAHSIAPDLHRALVASAT